MKRLVIITAIFSALAMQLQAQGLVDPNRFKKDSCTCVHKCGTDSVCIKADSIKTCIVADSVKRDSLCVCRKGEPEKMKNGLYRIKGGIKPHNPVKLYGGSKEATTSRTKR